MAWGEGTLSARCQLSVNRHYVASVVPRIQEILEDYLLKVAEDGVDGLQIDKLCVGSILDFNPAQMGKPDTANFEGLVSAIASLYEKAREINPDFCIAAECSQDRMIPYIDVYYRCAWGHMISPLRYVFPEWTACNHVAYPKDYYGVNGRRYDRRGALHRTPVLSKHHGTGFVAAYRRLHPRGNPPSGGTF